MLRVLELFILLLPAKFVLAQQPVFKLFLVGDAGENELTGETLDSLSSKLHNNPNSAIVFLGDNCYKDKLKGIIPGFVGFDSSRVTQRKVISQLDIINGYKGAVYFVPGNHDWWNSLNFEKGKHGLKMEQVFITDHLEKNTSIKNPDSTVFQPSNGIPGPSYVDVNNDKLRLIFMDTQWFLMLGLKKTPAENAAMAKAFYTRLDSVMAEATRKGERIVLTGHHPMYTEGPMSKKIKHPNFYKKIKMSYTTWPAYENMSAQVNAILKKYPGSYYASGHVHALQYFNHDGIKYIVSGSGSKTIHITKRYNRLHPTQCDAQKCMLWNEQGFYEIDFTDGGDKIIQYHNYGKESRVF